MASFNKVIILGHLVRDPELRVTPKGTAVCNFTLGVNSTWTDKEGNKMEDVAFIDVDSFGKQAEVITKYMAKGKPLLVEGRLKQDSWEDKETKQKRSKLKVVLESFTFVGGGEKAEGGDRENFGANARSDQRQQTTPAARQTSQPSSRPASNQGVDEEDVPF